MAIVYFQSLPVADLVHVEFAKPDGSVVTKTLLVDSGFTGQSAVVLSNTDIDLIHAPVPTSQATGAIHGTQNRGLVVCQIPALSFKTAIIAILSDLSALSLPSVCDGIVGLTFLRQFKRWGAERTPNRTWQFFLSDSP